MLESFLLPPDVQRAERVVRKLSRHGLQNLVLTGGWAVEIHHVLRGSDPVQRALGDIDWVTTSFASLSATLEGDFLFRHVHPFDPPNKMILQAVDADEVVRIDVFRDGAVSSRRARTIDLAGCRIQLISAEDLLARMARLCLKIAIGEPVGLKYARDFLRLLQIVDAGVMQPVWSCHREPNHPEIFPDACELLQKLIATRKELFISPDYSQHYDSCKRCVPMPDFPLADPKRLYTLFGYY